MNKWLKLFALCSGIVAQIFILVFLIWSTVVGGKICIDAMMFNEGPVEIVLALGALTCLIIIAFEHTWEEFG